MYNTIPGGTQSYSCILPSSTGPPYFSVQVYHFFSTDFSVAASESEQENH